MKPSLPAYTFKSYDIDLNELMIALSQRGNSQYFDSKEKVIVTQLRLRNQMAAAYGVSADTLLQELESGKLAEDERILTPADALYAEYFAKQYLMLVREENAFLTYHLRKHFNAKVNEFRDFTEELSRSFGYLFPVDSPKLKELKVFPRVGTPVKKDRDDESLPSRQVDISYTSVARDKEDKLTRLSHESTAALFYYLRKENFILGQEDVNDTLLAKVIQILTGYRSNMRTKVSKGVYDKHDLVTLRDELEKIISLIDNRIQ